MWSIKPPPHRHEFAPTVFRYGIFCIGFAAANDPLTSRESVRLEIVPICSRSLNRRQSLAKFALVRRSSARRELDTTVLNIELTLASIIQGVALYFLIDNARNVVALRDLRSTAYVAAGLCVIFIFWSRSIIHTLTLIAWPLEFGHNFFYIACTLGESVLFTCIGRPKAWFGLSTAYAAVVWLLFLYDLRLLRTRAREACTDAELRLYGAATADQWLNIRLLIPALFAFNLACLIAIYLRPVLFLNRGAHYYLCAAQAAGFVVYLWYVTRFFATLAPLIAATREE